MFKLLFKQAKIKTLYLMITYCKKKSNNLHQHEEKSSHINQKINPSSGGFPVAKGKIELPSANRRI